MNRQIRNIGKKILLYRPLPAPCEFHRSRAKNRWIFGGNRSGKSEGCIGYDLCCFALGVHPYRKTPKNSTIWAAANSWPLVGKLLWSEKIKSYLPTSQIQPGGISWHNKADEIPAELRLINGNRIEFKAYEQGRKAFEGRAIDAFYGDEQCKSDSEAIWTEIQARLMDKGGFSAQSMTPIIPQAWLEERVDGLPETDDVFYADLMATLLGRHSGCSFGDWCEVSNVNGSFRYDERVNQLVLEGTHTDTAMIHGVKI